MRRLTRAVALATAVALTVTGLLAAEASAAPQALTASATSTLLVDANPAKKDPQPNARRLAREAALARGVTPVVCVGETLAEREAGHTEEVVKRQLSRRTKPS